MADFKSEFFNLERVRNTLMSRIGEYLMLPKKLDDLTDTVNRMTNPRKEDFKIVLPSLKTRVNDKITQSLALKDSLFTYMDKVQKNAELQKVLTGQVGIVQFAMNTILGPKTDVKLYTDYLNEAVKLSAKTTKMVKDMEMLKDEITNVEKAIKNNLVMNPLTTEVPEPKNWLTSSSKWIAIGGVTLLAGIAILKNKKK
jgi:hypothetical protein